jgi:glutathione S-transferase
MKLTMPKLELISHYLCPYVQRAVITLLEKGIPHDRTYIDLANKPDWFLKISPLGKVPLLKVENDILFESAVICEYLDEITPDSLHPADPLIKAKHRGWIEYGSSILNVIAGFYNAPTPEAFEIKRIELKHKFEWIERDRKPNTYFSGDSFSLVDATFAPIFRYFDVLDAAVRIPKGIADFDIFTDTPNVTEWRHALQVRPSVPIAVVEDYPQRLLTFFKQRNSHLSTLII